MAKRRVPPRYRLVQFKFFYEDGSTQLVDVPEGELGRSGDDIDVSIYFAKKNDAASPVPPKRMMRTGRRYDMRTGDRV